MMQWEKNIQLVAYVAILAAAGCAVTQPEPRLDKVPTSSVTESAAVEREALPVPVAEPPEADGQSVMLPPEIPAYDSDDVRWIQQRLQDLGYYNGVIDGSVGSATRSAIRNYQNDQDIEADGRPTAELREFMWRNGG